MPAPPGAAVWPVGQARGPRGTHMARNPQAQKRHGGGGRESTQASEHGEARKGPGQHASGGICAGGGGPGAAAAAGRARRAQGAGAGPSFRHHLKTGGPGKPQPGAHVPQPGRPPAAAPAPPTGKVPRTTTTGRRMVHLPRHQAQPRASAGRRAGRRWRASKCTGRAGSLAWMRILGGPAHRRIVELGLVRRCPPPRPAGKQRGPGRKGGLMVTLGGRPGTHASQAAASDIFSTRVARGRTPGATKTWSGAPRRADGVTAPAREAVRCAGRPSSGRLARAAGRAGAGPSGAGQWAGLPHGSGGCRSTQMNGGVGPARQPHPPGRQQGQAWGVGKGRATPAAIAEEAVAGGDHDRGTPALRGRKPSR